MQRHGDSRVPSAWFRSWLRLPRAGWSLPSLRLCSAGWMTGRPTCSVPFNHQEGAAWPFRREARRATEREDKAAAGEDVARY